MAIGASILRSEIRRHMLMNVSLVASCVVGATVVTNERGLFVPITADMSDTSRAFAAMFTQSRLLPEQISNVQMVTPLAPFEVTADSRDLRRRLMDALATNNDPVTGAVPQEFQQNASQMPTLDNQVLSLNSSGTTSTTAGAGGATGAGAAGSGGGSEGSSGTTVASSAPAARSAQPLTVADNTAQSQSASGVTDGSALGNSAGGTSPGDPAGPAAVPEPSMWAMLILGFGMIGYLLRARRRHDEQDADAAA